MTLYPFMMSSSSSWACRPSFHLAPSGEQRKKDADEMGDDRLIFSTDFPHRRLPTWHRGRHNTAGWEVSTHCLRTGRASRCGHQADPFRDQSLDRWDRTAPRPGLSTARLAPVKSVSDMNGVRPGTSWDRGR